MPTKQVILIHLRYSGESPLKDQVDKPVARASYTSIKASLGVSRVSSEDPEGASDFTKEIISVESEEDLLRAHAMAREEGIPTSVITDAGNKKDASQESVGVPTCTCVAIGPADAERIDKITGPEGAIKDKVDLRSDHLIEEIPYRVQPIMPGKTLQKALSIVRLNRHWWMRLPFARVIAFGISVLAFLFSILLTFLDPIILWFVSEKMDPLYYAILCIVISWMFYQAMRAFYRFIHRNKKYRRDPRFKELSDYQDSVERYNERVGSHNAWLLDLRGKKLSFFDRILVKTLHRWEKKLVLDEKRLERSLDNHPLGTIKDPLKIKALLEMDA